MVVITQYLVGCAAPYSGPTQYRDTAQQAYPVSMPSEQVEVRQALETQYRRWRGVPYQLGGSSKAGIDCSGFTQTTFYEQFNQPLPRTTEAQARLGQQVSAGELKAGDLVFFRTAVKVRHVGIYMGEGEFLHASTSRGVMISRLDNPYWQQHYWQARRLY
ncbi:MAG: NlpC/P60 family protein [Amphritea sp.]|nr:NlpC/P60 family protein [Amphritea sp.]